MMRMTLCLLAAGSLAAPAFGQPKEFSDDFLTVATYDSSSLYGACPAFGGHATKYTMIEILGGDIYNTRAVSRNGRFIISDREKSNFGGEVPRFAAATVGAWDYVHCGMVGDAYYAFTDHDICIYAGIMFDEFDLHPEYASSCVGADDKPGVANVDDDCDGTTDELDESPIHAGGPTFGPPYSDGGKAGCANAPSDGLPGIGGVDDDGDGTIDEYGELGMGNDSDDTGGRVNMHLLMKGDVVGDTSAIWINIDPDSYGPNLFAIKEIVGGALNDNDVAMANEIQSGYYQADRPYSFVFCASGTCYGGQLWSGTDMANPSETVGPVLNTNHTVETANRVAFAFNAIPPDTHYMRAKKYLGNSNFGATFWVCEGTLYPAPSADLDKDRDVDGFDFLTFSNCYNGSNKPPLAACTNILADLDKDGDVDGFDFLTFSNCYNGSNRKPLAACFPPNLTTCGT